MAWNDMNASSPYVSSKCFIEFIQPAYYKAENEKFYSGYVDLKITCATDIYIGSGFSYIPDGSNQMVYQTMMYDGKPVIPGSSFKGVVRNIASAVSNSCLPKLPKDAHYPNRIRPISCKPDNGFCIVCDMFGAMSKGSKVLFSDMYSENARLDVKRFNAQYGPKSVYTENDGTAKGYKFYRTGDNKYEMPSKINAQVVKKGAVFTGRVHFKKLTEEELSLLMFSLGLDKNKDSDIVLKIGGFKNEGIGEISVEQCGFKCSEDIKKAPGDLAHQYYDMNTANQDAIDKLCTDILVP